MNYLLSFFCFFLPILSSSPLADIATSQIFNQDPISFNDLPSSCSIPELMSSRNTPEYIKYFDLSLLPSRSRMDDHVIPYDFTNHINYDMTRTAIFFSLNDLNIRALKKLLELEAEKMDGKTSSLSDDFLSFEFTDRDSLAHGYVYNNAEYFLDPESVWSILFKAPSNSSHDLMEIVMFLLLEIGTPCPPSLLTMILEKLISRSWVDASPLLDLLSTGYTSYDENFISTLHELMRCFPHAYSHLFEQISQIIGQKFLTDNDTFLDGQK